MQFVGKSTQIVIREVRFKKVSQRVFFPRKSKICKIFWSMRRMAMGVSAFESPDLGVPSRYRKHIVLSFGKFFRGLWSRKVQSKWAKSQVKFRNFEMSLTWDFAHFYWTLRLQRPPKNILELKSICLRYLEGPPWPGLWNAPTFVVIRHIYQLRS